MNGNLPETFQDRIRRQLGDQLPAFLLAMEKPAEHGIRMNPAKPCEAAVRWMTADRILWETNGWYLNQDETPGSTIWHEAGAFYLQDPAAMIPVNVLDPKPGEYILDLCAAPGGKATQIGTAMKGKGLLVCNEPIPKRAQILSRNLERMGILNAAAVCALPEQLAEKWPDGFDAVLVDAPCSGEGMFRKDKNTRDEWTKEKASGCAARQKEILSAAARLVRPGGRMVYSTCTFNPEENEGNVEWFLKEHREWEIVPFRINGVDGSNGMITCWPHRMRGEGQFAALLKRNGIGTARIVTESCEPMIPGKDAEMIELQFPGLPKATHRLGGTFIHLESCPDLKGIRVYRLGLHLGEIRGKTFFPDHASAFVMREKMQNTELQERDALRYMAGEQTEGEEKGWTVVCCRRVPLGWGKGSGGVIKNHYPKGLWNTRLTV